MELLTFKAVQDKDIKKLHTVGYTDERHVRISELDTGIFTCRVASATNNWIDGTSQMVCKDIETATIVANVMIDIIER